MAGDYRPSRPRAMSRHIAAYFADKPIGHVARLQEIALYRSVEYPNGDATLGAISATLGLCGEGDLADIEPSWQNGRKGAIKVALPVPQEPESAPAVVPTTQHAIFVREAGVWRLESIMVDADEQSLVSVLASINKARGRGSAKWFKISDTLGFGGAPVLHQELAKPCCKTWPEEPHATTRCVSTGHAVDHSPAGETDPRLINALNECCDTRVGEIHVPTCERLRICGAAATLPGTLKLTDCMGQLRTEDRSQCPNQARHVAR